MVVTDSSDSELKFEEPKPWTEHPWLNSDKEVLGITIKGKHKSFRNNSAKIVNLMKKRIKIYKVNDTEIKVTRHIFKKSALCCKVEVTSKNGSKDKVEVTLYEATKTISLLRKSDVDHYFVELLHNVLTSFLEKLLSGATEGELIAWASKNSKPIMAKTTINNCNLCTFMTKSKVALKRHYTIVHTAEVSWTKKMILQCERCQKFYKTKETLKNHEVKCHTNNVSDGKVQILENRIIKLEQKLQHYQEKEIKNNPVTSHQGTVKPVKCFENTMDVDKIIPIPSHLRAVNPDHLPLLKGYRMFCQALGNGACGTNCGAIHTLEDDSPEAGIKMKQKINHHMADNFENIYQNVIGIPYIETVFGEVEKQICNSPEELKAFLRSDRALNVYSNMQEIQAMANIFNIPIDVFSYSTGAGAGAGWKERILPMAEAAHLAEFEEGNFPPMALYHNSDSHFDLLVADTDRLATCGLLGRVQEVQQEPQHLQEEGGWHQVKRSS